jgi:carbon monoxide dehydrogenase subunit G
MPIKVVVDYKSVVHSPWDHEKTFLYFSDLEKAIAPNFPGLEAFTKTGDNLYQWIFESVKYGGYEFQIKFTTKVRVIANHHIELESVPKAGDSDLTGGWKFKDAGGKTEVHFSASIGLELPIPFFLKSMATPVTQKEITKLFDRYIANVSKALS